MLSSLPTWSYSCSRPNRHFFLLNVHAFNLYFKGLQKDLFHISFLLWMMRDDGSLKYSDKVHHLTPLMGPLTTTLRGNMAYIYLLVFEGWNQRLWSELDDSMTIDIWYIFGFACILWDLSFSLHCCCQVRPWWIGCNVKELRIYIKQATMKSNSLYYMSPNEFDIHSESQSLSNLSTNHNEQLKKNPSQICCLTVVLKNLYITNHWVLREGWHNRATRSSGLQELE